MKKVKPMQILLTQKEISAAVYGYVKAQGLNLDDKNVSIEFTATRSRETGVIGTVTILNDGEVAPVTMATDDNAPALNVINAQPDIKGAVINSVPDGQTQTKEPVIAAGTKNANPAPFLAAVETKTYQDGVTVTGTVPLPDTSPVIEADKVEAKEEKTVPTEQVAQTAAAPAGGALFGDTPAANEAPAQAAAPTTTDNLFG